jgi:DNA repair protein RadC
MTGAQALLEKLIARVDPAADAAGISARLIERYGALEPVLSAPAEELMRVEGMRPPLARFLRMMPQFARYTALERFGPRADLSGFERARGYFEALFIGLYYEHFYLICLSKAGRLIHAPMVTRGTLDETAFYLRNMLEEALKARAHGVVLSHNHPGGTREASPGDVAATRHAIRALSAVGIPVIDHVIVANGRALSLRAAGLIDEAEFIGQAPGDRLLRGWLRDEGAEQF